MESSNICDKDAEKGEGIENLITNNKLINEKNSHIIKEINCKFNEFIANIQEIKDNVINDEINKLNSVNFNLDNNQNIISLIDRKIKQNITNFLLLGKDNNLPENINNNDETKNNNSQEYNLKNYTNKKRKRTLNLDEYLINNEKIIKLIKINENDEEEEETISGKESNKKQAEKESANITHKQNEE